MGAVASTCAAVGTVSFIGGFELGHRTGYNDGFTTGRLTILGALNPYHLRQLAYREPLLGLDADDLKYIVGCFRLTVSNLVYYYCEATDDPTYEPGVHNTVVCDQSDFVRLTGDSSVDWATLVNDPEIRTQILLAILMRYLFSHIDPYGDPAKSLLPPEILRLYQVVIAQDYDKTYGRTHMTTSMFNRRRDFVKLIQQTWAQVTISFATNLYPLDKFSANDPRLGIARQMEEIILETLKPFNRRTGGGFYNEDIAGPSGRNQIRNIVEGFAIGGLKMLSIPHKIKMYWSEAELKSCTDLKDSRFVNPESASYLVVDPGVWAARHVQGVEKYVQRGPNESNILLEARVVMDIGPDVATPMIFGKHQVGLTQD